MNNYCARCGGLFSKDMTVMESDDGGKLHYYCSWKIWKEKQEKLFEKTTGNRPVATLPKAVL